MDAKEIVHCALQIERSNADRSYGNILTLLGDLDKSHITAEQLETTDIVKVLYRLLKTCPDGSVKKTAKGLLSKWKRQYSKDRRDVKCTEESECPELSCRVKEAAGGGDSKQAGSAQTCDSRVESAEEEASSSGAKDGLQTLSLSVGSSSASCSLSSVRSKCVQLLLAALCPELPDQHNAAELAGDIEQHIHELHKSSQLRYKACVRSKVANLRNPKNEHLRQGLLSGLLSPEAFARMSAEEMASTELRQLREEYSSRGVSERQLPQGLEGTPTQKIRCKKCGGSDCRVTQVSRGALFLPAWVRRGGPDEDAMTFVTCSGCGQQWYHSGWVCL
ncbi:transcription elongation factor A N-terminal and central domain-containing protein [Morone saxatilis]|uniref:transcription elongation factor A N-terminal and central domain-containing protein n=1 Tax=Morone saxatilis TaxID=34816 RepID=UPI0015E257E0|nr:transcription elongation factor A N-terminal and central domain-containing protein [Morone saxatilis]